ncbi:hypothetical protein [Phormidium nigroviride]|uniref:hypothetical protein n=1 Tax=Phormidium nigroviride TaxID=482564 RepID=UPI0002F8F488|nr:hypothetical protein [Oscillatoria nigro-viridis]
MIPRIDRVAGTTFEIRGDAWRQKETGFPGVGAPGLKVFSLNTIQIFPMKLSFVRRLSEQVASAIDEINGV